MIKPVCLRESETAESRSRGSRVLSRTLTREIDTRAIPPHTVRERYQMAGRQVNINDLLAISRAKVLVVVRVRSYRPRASAAPHKLVLDLARQFRSCLFSNLGLVNLTDFSSVRPIIHGDLHVKSKNPEMDIHGVFWKNSSSYLNIRFLTQFLRYLMRVTFTHLYFSPLFYRTLHYNIAKQKILSTLYDCDVFPLTGSFVSRIRSVNRSRQRTHVPKSRSVTVETSRDPRSFRETRSGGEEEEQFFRGSGAAGGETSRSPQI